MIECIPNISEGRRRHVIETIASVIRKVPGVTLLDVHSDVDHNRSVFTFVGQPEPVLEAAFQLVDSAAQHIDMHMHRGQHPRIGATDVLPLVPLSGISLQECAHMAARLGQRIGEELAIPVYLYEAAATCPERRELPVLRRGEFEGLATAIETDPQRKPDYGPARLGSAGATIVGARNPLIAYNVYLTSNDIKIAKAIARAIRGSSGGLRGVRALGLLVGGQAQVSMNLTDYKTTPLHRVIDMIAREAASYGVSIAASELVGLIPEDALLDAARYYLRLHTFKSSQILEWRIRDQ